MNSIRTVFALAIVVILIFIGLNYFSFKGYQKVERVNEWVLYYCESCDQDENIYDGYYMVNGFQEVEMNNALASDYFSDDMEQDIIEIIKRIEE